MYVARGELTVKKNPESLIGKWAVEEKTTHKHMRIVGGRRATAFWTGLCKMTGMLSSSATPEQIDSAEAAERYISKEQERVTSASPTKLDLVQTLEQQVPANTELVSGTGSLWQERRVPLSFAYFLGHATLLETVEYEASTGWRRNTSPAPATETQVGIMTPILTMSATFVYPRP